MRNKKRTWTMLIAAAGILGLLFLSTVFAGPVPMPLKAHLDLAKTVVVGKITDIVKEKEEGNVVQGTATIAVSETLKGTPAKEIKTTVVMYLDTKSSAGMASPPRVYSKGDEGIFVITPDDRPSHSYGLLPKDRLKEVKAALEELDKRTWSDEVNGLKVWACADTENPRTMDRGGVIFAVKNVSEKPIYLPYARVKGVVSAVARDSSGKEFPAIDSGRPASDPSASRPPLEPGETRYMHPYEENYGAIRISNDLPPGKYTITITLDNEVADGKRAEKPVKLWTGKIVAPSVTIEIPKTPASQAAK